MRIHHSSLLVSAVLVLAATSCANLRTGPSTTTASPNEALQSPIVASGTRFHARLESPLSSESARPGDTLTARLDEPLVAGDGTVVAPRGTLLTGRVLEVERGGLGRVTVRFDELRVRGRAYPIFTTLLRMQSTRVVASMVEDPADVATDVYPSSAPMPPNVGGGPAPATVPLESPPNAIMSFVLAQPFELPPAANALEEQNAAEVDRTFN
ncbi:MAG: hypothetical protein ACXVEF_35935 [Polyangiales bacterium]